MYRDRGAAGRRLVQRLRERVPHVDDGDVVVLGMVPGGMSVARPVAAALRAPLDIAIALRLSAPGYDALGIGGIASGGVARVDRRTIAMLGVPAAYVEEAIRAKSAEVELLEERCRAGRPAVPLEDRRVIIIDDGSQTRFRSRAVVAAARAAAAREVIFAVPVAASDMLIALAEEADAVVCDHVPERHCGIDAYYGEWQTPRLEEIGPMLGRVPPPPAGPGSRLARTAEPL